MKGEKTPAEEPVTMRPLSRGGAPLEAAEVPMPSLGVGEAAEVQHWRQEMSLRLGAAAPLAQAPWLPTHLW